MSEPLPDLNIEKLRHTKSAKHPSTKCFTVHAHASFSDFALPHSLLALQKKYIEGYFIKCVLKLWCTQLLIFLFLS